MVEPSRYPDSFEISVKLGLSKDSCPVGLGKIHLASLLVSLDPLSIVAQCGRLI